MFQRKHRLKIKKGAELSEWPLYDVMINYFQTFEPEYLLNLENETACTFIRRQKSRNKYCKQKGTDSNDNENEFQCELFFHFF